MLDVLVREASDDGSRRTRLSSPRARKRNYPKASTSSIVIDDRARESARFAGISDAFAAKEPRQV